MRRRHEKPRDDFEETFTGEPLPIRFGQPAEGFGADADDTGRIVFPPPDAGTPAPAFDSLPPPRPSRRRGGSGLVRGLVLGCVIGAAAGGFVALALSRWQPPPKTVADGRPAVLAQSLTPSPLSAQFAAEEADVATAPVPAGPPAAAPPAKHTGLDLASLAKAVGLRAPNTPFANAPAAPTAQAGDAIGLRPAAEDMPRLPAAATASVRAPIDPPQAIPPPAVERLAVGTLTPPTTVARPPVATPSFDCGGVRSPAELTICGDAGLAMADRRLLLAYDRAMASTKDRPGLHEDQARWLGARDQIGDDRGALSAAYQVRIRDLEAYDRRNRRVGLGKLLP